MSVGWVVKWCAVSRITTPLARKKLFLWISMKSGLVWAIQGNFEISQLIIVAAVTWLKYDMIDTA